MPYCRDSFFAGRQDEFTSEPHMQSCALEWSGQVANLRPHRGIDRVTPQALFDAEERAFLLALPAQAFEIAHYFTRTVPPDIHIKAGRALYSVPWRHIGKVVDAKESARTVEIYLDQSLVATHVRIDKGRQTNYDHYPPEKIAFMMATPAWCRRRAGELGGSVLGVVAILMEVNALYRLRAAQGVVGLADTHGAERLEAACKKALGAGDPTYRTIKGILTAGAEADSHEEQVTAPSAPAHLHGPERLFEIGGAL